MIALRALDGEGIIAHDRSTSASPASTTSSCRLTGHRTEDETEDDRGRPTTQRRRRRSGGGAARTGHARRHRGARMTTAITAPTVPARPTSDSAS